MSKSVLPLSSHLPLLLLNHSFFVSSVECGRGGDDVDRGVAAGVAPDLGQDVLRGLDRSRDGAQISDLHLALNLLRHLLLLIVWRSGVALGAAAAKELAPPGLAATVAERAEPGKI